MTVDKYSDWQRSAARPATGVESRIEALGGWVDQRPVWQIMTAALVAIAVIGVGDYLSGPELAFSIFYLAPVALVAWFVSRRAGLLFAALAAVVWGYLDIVSGPDFGLFAHAWNACVRFAFFAIVVWLAVAARRAHAQERLMARTDSLTGTANGRAFEERADLDLAMLRRFGRPLTLAYIDLDRFKEINDAHGHSAGDEVLCAVAEAIRSRLRATDQVARLGGDEFAILLPDTDRSGARRLLDDVESAVEREARGRWRIGLTVGAVTFTAAPGSTDDLVRIADAAMYRGKRSGRGIVIHEDWPSGPTTGSGAQPPRPADIPLEMSEGD